MIGTVGDEQRASVALMAVADHVVCYKEVDFAKKVNDLTVGNVIALLIKRSFFNEDHN